MKIPVIVYTRNRACQLDFMLRTLGAYFPVKEAWVLCDFTDNAYAGGYMIVREYEYGFPVYWRTQDAKTFRNVYLSTLGHISTTDRYIMGMTDDTAVIEPVNLEPGIDAFDETVLTLSLRMGLDTTTSYMRRKNDVPQPPLDLVDATHGVYKWKWLGNPGTSLWGYPFSIEANVYRAKELFVAAQLATNWWCPNILEGELHLLRENLFGLTPNMTMYGFQSIVGIPANIVQNVSPANRHANRKDYSPEKFEERFLGGERISMATIRGLRPTSSHMDVTFKWESR